MSERARFSPMVVHQPKPAQQTGLVKKTISVPKNMRLPDEGRWINKILVRSSSSDNVWVVSQDANTGVMGCSCPGWKNLRKSQNGQRRCKHIGALGLPQGVRVELKLI